MASIVPLLVAFAVGALPFAVVVGRLRDVDVLREGSGNPGATNVWRVAGRSAGLIVLLIDAAKGWVVVVAARGWLPDSEPWLVAAIGAAAILGHVFSPFLRFRGGKGVATSAGVIGALAPRLLLAPLALFAITFALRRRVSEASLVAAVTLPAAALLYRALPLAAEIRPGNETIAVSVAIPLLLFWTHRGNIRRLKTREESELEL